MSWKVASFVFLPMAVNLRMKPHCSSSCSAFEKSALSVSFEAYSLFYSLFISGKGSANRMQNIKLA